jgi:type I restriction enzyme S subunit
VNWKQSTIGSVLSVIKNGINCEQNKVPTGEKITRIETIAKQYFDFNRVGYASLNEAEKEKSRVRKGDILFSHINSPIHVGKTAIYESDEDLFHGINLLLFRTVDDVNPHFFNLFLNYLFVTGYWEENCKKSVNQASVNQKDISKVKFNYPPLSIQHKIVSKLNLIFAEIDKAVKAAESNANNSEALKHAYLNYIFNTNLYQGKKYTLGEICKFNGGSQPAKSFFEYEKNENNIRFIQIRDYKSDKNLVYIPKSLAKRFCDEDDVMIGRYGPPVFQILRGIRGSYNVALMKAIPNEEVLTKDFLYFFLQNPAIQNYVISLSNRAAGQSGLNKETIEPYELNVPSLLEQNEAIINILNCFQNADKLKKSSINKINELKHLKQSILHSAFNGELVKE